MLLPFRTDAPIYHWPYATVGLIAVNTLVLFAMMAGSFENPEDWILEYGRFNPLQWFTSNFIHGGPMHLVGNMFFLWGFGLVVEGKLGWWKFLAIYLGLGVVQSGIEQILMLGANEGGSLGASAILYGLMAMAMVWAPKNELGCILLVGRFVILDVTILTFAGIYIITDLVIAWLQGFTIGTSVLHLMGGTLGLVLGVALLKMDVVDCENWDLFAVWEDRKGKTREQAAAESAEADQPKQRQARASQQQAANRQRVHQLIADGDAFEAWKLYQSLSLNYQPDQFAREDLLAMVKELLNRQMWTDGIELMVACLRAFPEQSSQIRLRLAQVLIVNQQRPKQALRVLSKITAGSLPEASEKARRQLIAKAKQVAEQGAIELEAEDW